MKLAVFCFVLITVRVASSLPLAADNAGDTTLAALAGQQAQQQQPAPSGATDAAAAPAAASSEAQAPSAPEGAAPAGSDAQAPAAAAAAAASGADAGGGQGPVTAQTNSFTAEGAATMGLSTDNGAAVASADGITMDKLYAGIDLDNLVQPYGKPEDQAMDVPPVELPPVEEEREGDNRHFLQIYPEINKQQQVVSNKLINTYSTQNKRITVRTNNTVAYLKTLNVNTNYVTNVQRVNHPKQQIQTLTFIQNRYVPKLIVKHTRTDRLNELPPKEVVVPPVVQESTSQLPPIVEKVEIEREDYDPAARTANGAAGTSAAASGADAGAAGAASAGEQQAADQQAAAPAAAPAAAGAAEGEAPAGQQQQQPQQPAAPAAAEQLQTTQIVGTSAADQPNLARKRKSLRA